MIDFSASNYWLLTQESSNSSSEIFPIKYTIILLPLVVKTTTQPDWKCFAILSLFLQLMVIIISIGDSYLQCKHNPHNMILKPNPKHFLRRTDKEEMKNLVLFLTKCVIAKNHHEKDPHMKCSLCQGIWSGGPSPSSFTVIPGSGREIDPYDPDEWFHIRRSVPFLHFDF